MKNNKNKGSRKSPYGNKAIVTGTGLVSNPLFNALAQSESKLRAAETELAGLKTKAANEGLIMPGDCRCITWEGGAISVTVKQAAILVLLRDAWNAGRPDLSKMALLGHVESETSDMKSIFKNSPLWRTLVVSGERKGTYRLKRSKDSPQIPR